MLFQFQFRYNFEGLSVFVCISVLEWLIDCSDDHRTFRPFTVYHFTHLLVGAYKFTPHARMYRQCKCDVTPAILSRDFVARL